MAFKQKLKSFFSLSSIEDDIQKEDIKIFEKINLFTLTKNKLFLTLILSLISINILVGFDLKLFYIRTVLTFLFLILVPGILIMLAMKIRELKFWEYLVYAVGLSISFIMFAGLSINWLLPFLKITNTPLSTFPILICFNIFLIILGIIAWKRNNKFKAFSVTIPKLDFTNNIFFIIPMLFPILSILGAFLLNNNGSNILTIIMICGITIYVLLLIIIKEKLNNNIWPWALYWIGLSLLLMYSMRSWNIIGFDIHQELQMFNITKSYQLWDISHFRDAYNSMLSITILPVILDFLLKINSQYIFKVLFQLIFATVPVILFLFFKRYSNNIIAFLASFFFIAQFQFMQQMPALARQEIAFLFFGLILFTIFSNKINKKYIGIFIIIFGFSMIVSHYSTSYIAIPLLIFTYIIIFILKKTENINFFNAIFKFTNFKNKHINHDPQKRIKAIIFIILIIFSFFWLFQLTEVSDGLTWTIKKSIDNIGKIFTNEMKSRDAMLALGYGQKIYNFNDIRNYHNNVSKLYKNKEIDLYNTKNYDNFQARPIYSKYLPIVNKKIQKTIFFLDGIPKKALKIFLFIGILYLLFFPFRKIKISKEYIIMSLICLFLIILILLLPYLSISYNFERLYQQTLMILSLPIIFGGIVFFKFISHKYRIIFITILMLLYFMFYSGLVYQTTGGSAKMNLNNMGEEYGRFFVSGNEIQSANWFSNNYNYKSSIYSDRYGELRLKSFSKIKKKIIWDILPSTISKSSYVYSTRENKINNMTRINYRNIFLAYNFPIEFLNKNKNKIYNNGGSEIFK